MSETMARSFAIKNSSRSSGAQLKKPGQAKSHNKALQQNRDDVLRY
jgi:hypothetical protein